MKDSQQRAARYYLSKKREEQAIAHYKGIGATGEIANILNDYGRTMIEQGKLERLLYFLSYLTESNKNDNYLLWIYEGDIHRYRSQYDRALACYKQGEKMAHTYGDSLGFRRMDWKAKLGFISIRFSQGVQISC